MVISFLELKTFADALTRGGVGPVADEMRRSIEWHMDRVPKPGQSKDEFNAEKEAKEKIEGGVDVDIQLADEAPGGEGGEEKPGEEQVADGDVAVSPGPARTDVDVAADDLLPEPPPAG